ncbi:hypothetical protein [Streptosporangium sp. NBC_01756]|uniref:hypothetical protein n=1 Tax=Streptosporangium sp. NBC_01756 TaxID=2975950 RepID=UPI002DD8AE43|nr:hypothetical protein [Streptosporangium sp. NBC_01756]WSC85954.1 hypothetical protein OIE48_37250 [Streptosporangium sp. NBC_01756]
MAQRSAPSALHTASSGKVLLAHLDDRHRARLLVAAVGAPGPTYRFSEERLHELAPVLARGAEDIGHRLDCPG